MDPEKPEKEKPEEQTPAEKRAEVRARARAQGQASVSGKPALTEKQRIEARRKRQAKKRRPVAAGGNALSRGMRATGFEVQRTALFLGRALLSGIDSLKPAGESVAAALRWLIAKAGSGLILVRGLIGRSFARLGRLLLSIDRKLNTRQAFTLVALVAAPLLIASQFLDYRAIEIGQPAYSAVQEITRAPRSEVKTPIDTHSLLLVIAGVVALGAGVLSILSRKRFFGLIVAGAGGLTLLVALAIDLPAGLDAEVAELSYAGVKAILLTGFWLELATGAVLLVSGLALLLEPGIKPAHSQKRSRGSDREAEQSQDGKRTPERSRGPERRPADGGNIAGGQA